MIHVLVRVYGPLNDFLPPRARGRELERVLGAPAAVKDVIEALGPPHPEVELVLVDGVSVGFDHRVIGGERIAAFPRFLALGPGELSRVAPPPLEPPRFLLDVHLGRLAAYLRALGADTEYSRTAADLELARSSREHQRTLLTRDVGLLKRSLVIHGYWVRSTDPERQLYEVAQRFELARTAAPFTRCVTCNGALEPVDKRLIAAELPPRTRAREEAFTRCGRCGQVFWPGSHHDRMTKLIRAVLEPGPEDPP